jgi:ATP-dependent helicase/nuclease subunit A
LTASVKDMDRLREKWKVNSQETLLPDYVRSRAKGYLDWIGPAIARHPDTAEKLQANGSLLPHSSRFNVTIIESASLLPASLDVEELLRTNSKEEDFTEEIAQRFDFRYPYQYAVEKRSKQSVSEMKRLQMLQRMDEPESFIQAPASLRRTLVHRPDFMQDKRLSAADIGTAVHAVMQHIPFDRKLTAPEIEEFVGTLMGMEILSPEEGKAVNIKEIERFYNSDLSSRLAKAKNVRREVPFTYAKADGDGDYQIIQGIVDCLFEEEDGWVLLDYKTDSVYQMADIAGEMAARYSVQLSVYQEAVEEILQIPIKERLLYLFAATQTVKI